MEETKTFTIQPSWKHLFFAYLLSVITIPLAGIGLIALYFTRKKHNSIRYKITDNRITAVDSKYEHNVDLVDIRSVNLTQDWLQTKLGIATLVIHTSASKMKMVGIEDYSQLKSILEQAVEAEKKRHQQRQKTERKKPEHSPGTMDKIEYLTGLWQQGLISEEDYNNERGQLE